MTKVVWLGAAWALTVICAAPVHAAPVMRIAGTGLWAANAPTTPYSQADEPFAFSFQVPIDYTYADYGTVKVIDPTEVRDIAYSLAGVALPTSISAAGPPNCAVATGLLCAVELVTSSGGGGLNLDFGDVSVDFYSPSNADVGTSGRLAVGKYTFIPNINGDPSPVDGQINEGTSKVSLVPEPAAWAMMLIGLGLAGGALRRTRRGTAPA